MDQPTFADLELQNKKRKTRREQFLERVEGLITGQRLEGRNPSLLPQGWSRTPAL